MNERSSPDIRLLLAGRLENQFKGYTRNHSCGAYPSLTTAEIDMIVAALRASLQPAIPDASRVVASVQQRFQPATPTAGEPKPAAWQYRCRPPGTDKWSNWRPCEDPRDVEDIAKHGKLAGYDAEARPLYLAAATPAQPSKESIGVHEALSLAYHELKLHDADYHHRTSVEVNNKIVDALTQQPVGWQWKMDNGQWCFAEPPSEDELKNLPDRFRPVFAGKLS